MRIALPLTALVLAACSKEAAFTAAGDADMGGGGVGQAGTLTAGAWDDNDNYDTFETFLSEHTQLSGRPEFSQAERDAAHARSEREPNPKSTLDIALVLDTTSSMGDELSYLQTEFDALADQITASFPNAQQRWALVLYRDRGDRYRTEVHDFTSDLQAFQTTLSDAEYDGGGDYPEAPDRALGDMVQLDWRSGRTARLAFWIADAPHHSGAEIRFADAIRSAVDQDIHIYPVAASGTDYLAEYSMRSAAQLTLGRYLFLTDDSGVGETHAEPDVPCYFVTRLDHAVLRMVDIEMTGTYREPTEDEIIRTGGDPENGACQLDNGEIVLSY